MNRRAWLWFLLVNALLALVVFRGALWGDRLLAPLDVAPALFSKYHWLDSQNSGVPANHYTIDQLTYDLPLQRTIYQAYRRGEIPWWDPYTFSGRPLLADAHINGTDPLRLLCYATLPFELAYNWTLILHWFVGGLAVFALLRSWCIRALVAGGLALAYECSGYGALFFGHPWNTGAFLYYPWIWLAWDQWQARRTWWSWPVGTIATAGVFCAGNLQSHAYVVIFAGVYLVAYGGASLTAWRRALPMVAGCGLLGAALAAPVLAGQLEFYRHSLRAVPIPLDPRLWLSGVASLAAVFPWTLGTFRTLDLSKLMGPYQTALGFVLFIGSAGVVLAALGAWRGNRVAPRPAIHRCAWLLVLAYLVILSTPLQSALYTRSGGLAVLGLVVLAALGIEHLWRNRESQRVWGVSLAGLTLAVLVALNVAAFLVYPRVEARVRTMMQARSEQRGSLSAAPALDDFQVRNLPNEISVRNAETVFAALGLLWLAALFLRPGWRESRWALPALLAWNLAPAAMFYARFIPNQPVSQWHDLLAGGPVQRGFAGVMGGTPRRLLERAPSVHDQVFPNSLGHLHRVRTVHGYSALVPQTLANLPEDQRARLQDSLADFTVTSVGHRGEPENVVTNGTASPVNFQWRGPQPRAFDSEILSLNRQRVVLGPGPAGTLLWTDTAYPGWRAEIDGHPAIIRPAPPTFSEIEIPAGGRLVLNLRYEPSGLRVALALAGAGALALLGTTRLALRRGKRSVPAKA